MVGVSPTLGLFYMFVNAVCMAAVFTCPFLVCLQLYLMYVFVVCGTFYTLDSCPLLCVNPVLLSSQGCNLVTSS